MDRVVPKPPPVTPCPNPDCLALPEATIVCRFCGTSKIAASVDEAFRAILRGEDPR